MLETSNTYNDKNKVIFSIIIPFFNEEENIKFVMNELIEALSSENFLYEIIAVNNGSTDKSAEILQVYSKVNFIKIVTVEENKGFAWGIRQGVNIANGKWICFFGGDGQTYAGDVVEMLRFTFCNKKIRFLTGYRISRHDGIVRYIISKIFNNMFRFLFKVKIQDINGTPKIIDNVFINKIDIRSMGWFIDAELILNAKYYNMSIVEYPVKFRKRNNGKTHIRLESIYEFIKEIYFYYFIEGFR